MPHHNGTQGQHAATSTRGGPRPNSGRPRNPPGGKTDALKYEKVLSQTHDRLISYGLEVPDGLQHLTPLDTMMYLMKLAVSNQDHKFALECARNCAPYLHPRLSMAMISHTSESKRPDKLSDDQLQNLIYESQQVLDDRNAVEAVVSPQLMAAE